MPAVRWPQVWRANLRRDLSLLAGGGGRDVQALEAHLRDAYREALRRGGHPGTRAEALCRDAVQAQAVRTAQPCAWLPAPPMPCRLIQRCGTKSLAFWAAQRAGGAPTQATKQHLYQAAMQAGCRGGGEGMGRLAGPHLALPCNTAALPLSRPPPPHHCAEGAERAAGGGGGARGRGRRRPSAPVPRGGWPCGAVGRGRPAAASCCLLAPRCASPPAPQVPDPDAVELEGGDGGEAGEGDAPLPGASRGSSEESETSALGL